MSEIDRRTLLYLFGIASVTPLLRAQTPPTGKVAVAKPGESRFTFATAQQGKLSPCKLTSDDTAGACSTFELSVLPQTGPQLHVHHREDEWYYVLSGEFIFKAGSEEHTLPTGGSIWLPKGLPHTWANISAQEGKLILLCVPGGFEKFFDEMAREMVNIHDADAARKKMNEVMAKYGMELLGPPLFKSWRQMQ